MTIDEVNIETREKSTLMEVERSLIKAAEMPYNTAAHIFSAAQEPLDTRMGGSCLLKLQTLRELLPPTVLQDTKIITSEIGQTTHYAAITKADGIPYYLDPFLWQTEPMSIEASGPRSVRTLENIWSINREPDEEGCLLVVSLNQSTDEGENKLITHRFTYTMDYLPSASALPLKPEQPSFLMQIPDQKNQKLYKLWFPKHSNHVDTIWTLDGRTGARSKITDAPSHSNLRTATMSEIEALLNTSEEEINTYFKRASVLEVELSALLNSSSVEIPVDHSM